jgi:hypothetical protein
MHADKAEYIAEKLKLHCVNKLQSVTDEKLRLLDLKTVPRNKLVSLVHWEKTEFGDQRRVWTGQWDSVSTWIHSFCL